ncbi:MAG: hypothetical protein VX466_02880 [Myxococcota bacterium]|nr:hypothetical protein [Myxococcota bacterium]
MSTEAEANTHKTLFPTAVGWLALVALGAYAIFLHQGFGSAPGGWASLWWHPTSFLLLNPTIGGLTDVPMQGVAAFCLPAILVSPVVFLGTRSAIARALAVTLVVVCGAFAFGGFSEALPWELFHWRLSIVMVWIALAIGFAVMSPALSESWLRRGRWMRFVLYAPIAFAIIALIRNATGTDETLVMNFSPWPGISVFGLEIAAYTIVGILFGLAVGLGALAQRDKRLAIALVGVVVGVVLPTLWFQQRFANTEPTALAAIAILAAIALGLSAITRSGDRNAVLRRRAAHFALGACLVIAPVLAGRAWANADYTLNKFVRAKIASDALAEYYAKEQVYPDSLDELTAQNYLEELPRPRVGFDFLYAIGLLEPIEFSYRGLGSSYVLEFVSTEWVQCAYNPPWSPDAGAEYEYEDDEEYADEDDESGEAWSCPDTRPELWGNDEEGGEDDWGEEYDEEE